uniref:LysM domain-containing protein n=1 Tax=uncultured marine group II/III euryarchaeote AD1000_66_E09 TaxID=1457798 RepID=A0A075G0X1_9EURY|nr:hypothetical protein [uncultured marine group II/III euryarchaeote AD1000_66_E09]
MNLLSFIKRQILDRTIPCRPLHSPLKPRARMHVGAHITARSRIYCLVAIVALTWMVVEIWQVNETNIETVVVPSVKFVTPATGFQPTNPEFNLGVNFEVGEAIVPKDLPRPPEPPEPLQPLRFERFLVQPGDTLYEISNVYKVSIMDLLRFNRNLGDGEKISVGQTVLIPVFAK